MGDSLSNLAQQAGLTGLAEISGWVEECMRLNNLADASHIEIGQSLTLPSAKPAPSWQGDLYTAERYPGHGGQ